MILIFRGRFLDSHLWRILNKSLTSGKSLAIYSKSVDIIRNHHQKFIFVNIHTQVRLLVKYELVTSKNTKVRASQKSTAGSGKKKLHIVDERSIR